MKNLSLNKKIFIVLFSILLVSISGTMFRVYIQSKIDKKYSYFINQDDRTTINISRITDKINAILFSVNRLNNPE